MVLAKKVWTYIYNYIYICSMYEYSNIMNLSNMIESSIVMSKIATLRM